MTGKIDAKKVSKNKSFYILNVYESILNVTIVKIFKTKIKRKYFFGIYLKWENARNHCIIKLNRVFLIFQARKFKMFDYKIYILTFKKIFTNKFDHILVNTVEPR